MLRIAGRLAVVATLVAVLVVGAAPDSKQATPALAFEPIEWTTEGGPSVSQVIPTPASLIGITWEDEPPDSVWFRTRNQGRWAGWAQLPTDDDHNADFSSDEHARSRPGSDPVWIGTSEAVQFKVFGDVGSPSTATLIDVSNPRRPLVDGLADFLSGVPAANGLTPNPPVRPRSEWDPANTCVPKRPADAGQISHFFVHHTTGTNSYTRSEVPGRILAICLFHLNSRGWNDIGYNFLIDKYGQIWEGRAGGIEQGLQGAHTAGFNTYSVGVAFIGDHASSRPTAAAEAALVDLLTWKSDLHNVDTTGFATVVSKGSDKFEVGERVWLRPISGHTDAQITSCPGAACYARLPRYRSIVNSSWSQYPLSAYVSPSVGDFDGDDLDEAAIFRTSDGTWQITQPDGATGPWADFATSTGWSKQIVGDFNGDGRDDIANFHPSNGTWWISKSTGSSFTTSLWADFSTATGWSKQIVGDFNGDGRDDIANFHPSNGTWWISKSTGSSFTTSLWADFSTATGWSKQIVGDFNGDGRDDIANFHPSNGTWWISKSTGSSFTTSLWADFSTPTGWAIQVAGDFDGDGRDDIANWHTSNGTWWVTRSTGSDFLPARLWGTNTTRDHVSHYWTQDVDGDGQADLLTVDAYTGFLDRHLSTGTSFDIEWVIDMPWRTTVDAQGHRRNVGNTGWLYFGQEFQWVRLSDMDVSIGIPPEGTPRPSAGADVVVTLPRK